MLDAEQLAATDVDRSPPWFSTGFALVATLVAVLGAGAYSWAGLAIGAVGAVGLVAGLVLRRPGAVTVGAGVVVLAALVAGVRGAPALPLLASVTGAVVAWDVGDTALGLGRQLGRDAPTLRLEVVHAGASVLVGATTASVGYAISLTAGGGQPVTALVLALLAAVVLLSVLD